MYLFDCLNLHSAMGMRKLTFIFFTATAVALCGCARTGKVTMAFTGDIMMHIPVKASALAHDNIDAARKISLNNRGFDFLFERIREPVKVSEIVVGNMEFPVSPPFEGRPKIFNCYPEVIPAMKKAGFTMLNIANNHILDQGEKGIISTMDYLGKNGLDYLGVGVDERKARAGIVKTAGGIRVGFIGYTGYLNYLKPPKQIGYHLNWFYDEADVKSDIADIRKRTDFLVMVVHTGIEYAPQPRLKDSELMKRYINQGVDLIICHHTHLIQPVEKITSSDGRECFIFYSLGNFISNQDAKERFYVNGMPVTTRDSIIVRCVLAGGGPSGRPRARFEILPIQTVNEAGRGGRVIQTVSLSRERENLKKRLAYADEKEKVDINRRIGDLIQKSKAIKILLLKYYKNGEITYIE
jgi:hypothetical protein